MVNHGPHKRQKIRPVEQTPRYGTTNIPDPSLGGNGYSEDTRRNTILLILCHAINIIRRL